MKIETLISHAQKVLSPRKLSGGDAGDVASALVTTSGNVYIGVCIDVSSGIGFCAEHSAIAAMVTAGESQIAQIVAVWQHDTVLAPCGRCRELMNQIDFRNLENTLVIMDKTKSVRLRELLPHPYQETWS